MRDGGGEVLRSDERFCAEGHRTLDCIGQLAHVPGPLIARQRLQRWLVDTFGHEGAAKPLIEQLLRNSPPVVAHHRAVHAMVGRAVH
jgi:hypothetical protein